MANGILVIDKPAGWTSMDVCAKLRGILHEKRIGHGGTLDPMATGVLPVFVGQATRAVEFAEKSEKEYIAGLRLGMTTCTQDITGEVLEERPEEIPEDSQKVRAIFQNFLGEIQQIPPMYSAVKIHGQKLYQLARKGKEIARPPRKIMIYELELLQRENQSDYIFRCVCSKGTYIRTLCHDIGQALGCGGTLYTLRRTRAAGFSISQAVSLSEVQESGEKLLRPMDSLFLDYPILRLSHTNIERRVRNGNPVNHNNIPDGIYRVYSREGDFLCLSQAIDGTLTSIKNFFGA